MTDAPPDVPYHSPMEKTTGALADGNRMKRFFVCCCCTHTIPIYFSERERGGCAEETATCASFHFQVPGYQEHEPDEETGVSKHKRKRAESYGLVAIALSHKVSHRDVYLPPSIQVEHILFSPFRRRRHMAHLVSLLFWQNAPLQLGCYRCCVVH